MRVEGGGPGGAVVMRGVDDVVDGLIVEQLGGDI